MSADPTGLADLARHPRCCWLESASLMAWLDPDDVSLSYRAATREVTRHAGGTATVVGDDVFAVLEAELATGSPSDLWCGYVGYAARPDLPARASVDLPDAVWMRPSRVSRRSFLAPQPASPRLPPVEVRGTSLETKAPADYRAAFDRVQERLHAGDTYEVNLTHRIEVVADLDPVAAYERLRELNPAPYAGFVQHDVPGARAWLLSSSPERYALIGADGSIETKPIKGTTPRGTDAVDDEAQRRRLLEDPRFRAENLMIVDLLRNDLSTVCEPGSVEVPSLMAVESYASVHQLVSTVRGRLRPDVTTLGALRALFPAGSMTGAPKLRTMQVVDEVEATPRGAYAGAFGWIAGDGRADLGVVIRTLTTTGDGTWSLGTGGGVTVLSEVESEHAEAALKAARLLRVFAPGVQ